MTSSNDSELKVIEIDEDHVKAIAFNMLFLLWQKRTTAEAYRRAMDAVTRLAKQHAGGIGVMQILDRDSIAPDSATRKMFVEFLHMDTVKHFSVTYEGVGFKAASIRAVVASVHALARPKCSHAVHTTLSDAARWHARAQEKLGRRETAVQIERLAENVRKIYHEHFPTP
jgi:hypothetical protein